MARHNHFLVVTNFMMATLFLTLLCIGCTAAVQEYPEGDGKGQWQLLLEKTGVVAMHMALTHRNTVVMFDQTEASPSGHQLRRLSDGTRCTDNSDDLEDSSCYAHSMEYDIDGNTVRPLTLSTDTWCSSGSFLSNGTLVQTGGHGDGDRSIRYYGPCARNGNCDWRQSERSLADDRWYASNILLPEEDRVMVIGGRRIFTYEFVPKQLHNTFQSEGGNNLYPFLHICPSGRLIIFANRDSILFDYKENRVLKHFPRITREGSRNYPSSGSSVILPLEFRLHRQVGKG